MSFFQKLFSSGSSSVIGLDIGSHSIKLVQLSKTSAMPNIVKLDVSSTPSLAIKDGTIIDSATIATEVREMLKRNSINTKRVVSSVSGHPVVIRTITMTSMTAKELKNSIKYEAERYLPYSVTEAQISGMIMREQLPGDEKNMEVLLTAAPKEMVFNVEEVIRQSGLQIEAMDLEPFALMRIMKMTLEPELLKQTIALVNLGAGSTSINIFSGGDLRSSRTIAIAGNSFTKAIGQAMNVTFEEAEKLKKEKGVIRVEKDATPVAPTTMRIFNIILPVLTELVTEVQRSFDFYRSRYRGESVDIIYLCGGTANFKNLDRHFAGELGLRVEIFNPLAKMGKAGIQDMSQEKIDEFAEALPVVLGLSSWHF